MIALKETNNPIEVTPALTLHQEMVEFGNHPVAPSRTAKSEIGRMELHRSHKLILFSVKVYLGLMAGLFGYHFWSLLK